ncbi:MAG: flotillin-like protein FloA [Pirellulaceae bacterium]
MALAGFSTVIVFLVATVSALVTWGMAKYGLLWLQAFMSGAPVSVFRMVGMSLRQVDPAMIVRAQIMGLQAGLNFGQSGGISVADLECHHLAGGDVDRVLKAIIASHQAGLHLDFDRAAAIDLAGRDVLEAVRTSVLPKVIDCPAQLVNSSETLSAVAKNGIELQVHVLVTVRTNLDQLIGGATEETIIARVGQGIISVIGSSSNHMEVLEMPSRISQGVLMRGLDANTAFEIVSIDIAQIDVGENIGARLQTDQAETDTRVAQAAAEVRRANAVALLQERVAECTGSRANLLVAYSEVPKALAEAYRKGQFIVRDENFLPTNLVRPKLRIVPE